MERILRVKLYGQSFQIHKLKMDSSLMQRIQNVANEFNEPLQDAILNINFFNKLNIDNIRTINDLIDTTFKGLINNSKSQI
ncbi:hypothetical protein MHL31_05200 [Lutibacter sp. A80]|uniref:hypothetical protein n=1 Tax=Lutibacter sp. A80 TaxID=2918453 RepID=UPI001F06F912|nr:hypothetical protein [Lutibacter sp. A80]UMB61602.1 hypothetical protein MHL31_05200 [Lutibacter sp. A80]